MVESIVPSSKDHWLEMRSQVVTSTEISALFGASPYLTPFELWHSKKSATIVSISANERMTWGTRLEASIASGLAEDNAWNVRKMPEFIRDLESKRGSSFDYRILNKPTAAHLLEHERDSSEDSLLEIKNVDSLAFRDGWIVDGDSVEAPPHIELQLQNEMDLAGLKTAYIGALIGGNRVVVIKRQADEVIIRAIKQKVAEFWRSIEENNAPAPNFAVDAEFISKLYNHAEPGKVIDAPVGIEALVANYRAASEQEKAAKKLKDAAKAEMLTLVGDAEKVLGDGWSISAGLIGPAQVEAYERAGYRTFKLTTKKSKEK